MTDIYAPRKPAPVWLTPARTIQCWTVAPEDDGNVHHEARPVVLPDWIESPDDAAKAACNCLTHKTGILVLVSDMAARPERRHTLHTYAVRKRTRRNFIRNAAGETVREPEFYPDFVMAVCCAGFAPSEPWRWSPGADAVGNDKTLVEIVR